MDITQKGYDISYNCDGTETVTTKDIAQSASSSSAPAIPNITLSSSAFSNISLTAANGPYTYTSGTGTTNPWATQASGTVQAKDFILDGVSLKQVLEERLNMLVPNPALEAEWNELKELGDRYRALEADLNEKAKMWKVLKKT